MPPQEAKNCEMLLELILLKVYPTSLQPYSVSRFTQGLKAIVFKLKF